MSAFLTKERMDEMDWDKDGTITFKVRWTQGRERGREGERGREKGREGGRNEGSGGDRCAE
jgi:hypothetical protein